MKTLIAAAVAALFLVGCGDTLKDFRDKVDGQVGRVCDDTLTEWGAKKCEEAKAKLEEVRDKVDEVVE